MTGSKQQKSNGTRCSKCNRILTDPKSIAEGIGPICIKKVQAKNHALTAFFGVDPLGTKASTA